MTALKPDSVIARSAHQASARLRDEWTMLQTKKGEYYGLKDVGARVWDLLEEPRTVSELCDALLEEYEVDRERLAQDLDKLLAELREAELVDVRDGK